MEEAEQKTGPLNILLADDNEADIEIARLAFESAQGGNKLFTASDGDEIMEMVQGQGVYGDRQVYPRPDLILLDIRMPRMDGLTVLKKLKEDPEHRTIPVIMLSSSKHEKDIRESYANGASAYFQKPVHYRDFVKLLESLNAYWQRATLSGDSRNHS